MGTGCPTRLRSSTLTSPSLGTMTRSAEQPSSSTVLESATPRQRAYSARARWRAVHIVRHSQGAAARIGEQRVQLVTDVSRARQELGSVTAYCSGLASIRLELVSRWPIATANALPGYAAGTGTRLLSLDVFRGLTIIGMLIVN